MTSRHVDVDMRAGKRHVIIRVVGASIAWLVVFAVAVWG